MKFSVTTKSVLDITADCIIIGLYENQTLTEQAKEIDKATDGLIRKILKRGDIKGELEETLLLHNVPNINIDRILLVGLGNKAKFSEFAFRRTLQTIVNQLKSLACKKAILTVAEIACKKRHAHWKVRQAIEFISTLEYQFDAFKSKKIPNHSLKEIIFTIYQGAEAQVKQALKEGVAITTGMALTKDLGNTPANICTPAYIAEQAKKLVRGNKQMSIKVYDERTLEKMGMGAFNSVAKGSQHPGKMIVIEYKGNRKKMQPHIIVGKGITFDTGGISLKPPGAMDEMKYDMCGAASVLGALKAVSTLNLPVYVVGVIVAAENMPSGKASKPGDVVKTLSGQTVEILNTDAEGRLVLCDALTYIEKYKPQSVIDIATLTGAILVGLGTFPSGLFANDDTIVKAIETAADKSYDRVWNMPMYDDYQPLLKSNFADFANISGGRYGGSITAACYLSRFTEKYKWAHLDIAGTAWISGDKKGATGRPVPLLTQYLIDAAESA
ncbi:MAG: leucyl aminopeptidase [Pseudomonadota bacterium]